MCVL
jgi:chromosome segregation ATPase